MPTLTCEHCGKPYPQCKCYRVDAQDKGGR